MSQLSYPEAIVMGAIQGITELFPISSLGHSVIIPALIGGTWAKDLNVSAPESPYLAFIVGLHVATALALLVFFWRDWVRIIGGFFSSIRYRRVQTGPERLAWLIILATIPVGIAGLLLEHLFRTLLGQPEPAAIFLAINGLILFFGEWLRRRQVRREGIVVAAAESAEANADFDASDTVADARVSRMKFGRGIAIGSSQILALAAGISRSGVAMVSGMAAGLSHREAARFSFLLATPVILAAGVLKIPDLAGPLGAGITGQVLAGSAASFVAALLSVGFLDRYFRTRTLTPFAIYCLIAGIGSFLILTLR
ncbi:undecaprenyl-diphosphate phosphatase [Diaminobutyricibacter tongyongensis]|uniref:Undecaprenyl-diphosphatase n=1 Tax=Leifsonia tongyongensis TaxID=1268043 RepID=A0A6L9XWE8_9MICO|nr:undecaprenyl-diphosphate phosphatase [Diaminobutyricibacter tongyongensis]NEN05585.1 undecaprenyl-diphosphate phosphatase [Diaminobutyricibacter tongyongensis]